jgi:hypothetical protein
MLPIGDITGIAQSELRITMALDDTPSSNRSRENECGNSS